MSLTAIQKRARSARSWRSLLLPPTSEWEPGNHTCGDGVSSEGYLSRYSYLLEDLFGGQSLGRNSPKSWQRFLAIFLQRYSMKRILNGRWKAGVLDAKHIYSAKNRAYSVPYTHTSIINDIVQQKELGNMGSNVT